MKNKDNFQIKETKNCNSESYDETAFYTISSLCKIAIGIGLVSVILIGTTNMYKEFIRNVEEAENSAVKNIETVDNATRNNNNFAEDFMIGYYTYYLLSED